MRYRFKPAQWVVALVAVIFMLTQTALADLPVGGRRPAGKEAAQSWDLVQIGTVLSLAMDVSEEEQATLDLMRDAFSVVIRQSNPETQPGYTTYGLYLADEELVSLDVIVDADALYLSSPVLGDMPVKLDFLSFDSFVSAFEVYFASLQESGMLEGFDIDFSLEGFDPGAVQAFWETTLANCDPEPLLEAFVEWFSLAWEGELYDGAIDSIYGVEIASAVIYEITKEEIVQLLETIIPLLVKQDALIADIASFVLAQEGFEPTEAELKEIVLQAKAAMASFPYLAAMNIPDGFVISYNECYDENSELAVGEIECYLEQEESDPFILYIEWLFAEPRAYVYMSSDGSAFGLEGWFITDATSDDDFAMDVGVDFSSYWQDQLEQTFHYSIQYGTRYNELGQPDMDWTVQLTFEDSFDSVEFVYALSGTTAVDQDNPGTIIGNVTATEEDETLYDAQILIESRIEPAQGLPFDLNAPMYDVFNDTPEAFIQWLTVSIPEYFENLSIHIESLVSAHFE